MSGIGGIFYLDGRPVERGLLQQMTAAIAHRGPDEEGLWLDGSVGLVHCQLGTTPEAEREHQPFAFDGGRYVITCDGRVDNRTELIRALQGRAPVDGGTPDAELFLHAYIAWGADCLKRLVGDFAFAIWDNQQQRLFCARDPMGIRTFYYYRDDERFVFASDIHAILVDSSVPQEINELMVALYLMNQLTEPEQTFFKGIVQVAPSSYLIVSREGIAKHTYWEPNPWNRINYSTTEEYVSHFQQVFGEAVRCRLRSASPVGISLSGGLDSTSIACTAAQLVKQGQADGAKLMTFSSVFKDFPEVDESRYIGQVLENAGIKGQYIYADELWGFKPLRDTTLGWNRPYPLSFHARHEALLGTASGAGVRAMLTGEGGDELLNAGHYYLLDLLKGFHWARLHQELKYVTPESRRSFWRTATGFYKSTIRDSAPGPVRRMYRKLRPTGVPHWLNEGFIQRSGALEYEVTKVPELKYRNLYQQGQYFGPIGLARLPFLSYITEMYSHHNVEPRHPLLDLRVIEFLTRIPPHLKFRGGWTKLLLRQAMKGVLPDEVRLRLRKTHFNDVLRHGMRQERERILAMLEDGYLARAGWVKNQLSTALYDRFIAGEQDLNSPLAVLITLEEWLQRQLGSNGSRDPTRPSVYPASLT